MDDFFIRALLAGLGVASVAGVLGCFVVWRRMAYFGDSLAHSALLGIALGLITGVSVNIGIIVVCAVFAALLVWLQHKRVLATDTLLGILAHAALSIGMVCISLLHNRSIDLHSYLFGDILAVTNNDILWIYAGGLVVFALLMRFWSSLLLMTIHEDLAKAENVSSFGMHFLLMILMTLVVAVSIQIVGILLITSMLIIPAATARQISTSPKMMATLSSIIGMVAVVCGLYASSVWDTPSGPSIVTAAAGIFMLLLPISFALQARQRSLGKKHE